MDTLTRPADEHGAATAGGPVTLWRLLVPRRHTALIVGALLLATAAALYVQLVRNWRMWQAVALFLVMMLPAGIVKWRDDAREYGRVIAAAGAILVIQALHTIEHVAQWWQRHIFDRPLRQSNGLLSPANSEWVHFVWNWLVVAAVVYLLVKGVRGWYATLLIVWATAHALEHTYMWIRYLQILGELRAHGNHTITAQGVPGVVGNDGWLDRHTGMHASWVLRIPFLTTATRLDAHAVWNAGEVALLIPSINAYLRRRNAALLASAAPPLPLA